MCGVAKIAEQHRRPADSGNRLAGGLGDCIGNHTFVGALAEFTGQHPVEVVLLGFGGGGPQGGHHPDSFGLRAAALDGSHASERSVDVVNRQ